VRVNIGQIRFPAAWLNVFSIASFSPDVLIFGDFGYFPFLTPVDWTTLASCLQLLTATGASTCANEALIPIVGAGDALHLA